MKKPLPNFWGSRKRVLLFAAVLFFHSFVFSQTRFYLNLNTTAAVTTPSYNTNWNVTTGALKYETSSFKDGSTITAQTTASVGAVPTRKVLLDQWVSEPLAAQTINGSFTGQARFSINNTGTGSTGQGLVYIRILNSNGTIASEVGSVQTVLPNLTTTITNLSFSIPVLTPIAITAGQRICLELGWNYSAGTNTTRTANIETGSSAAADLLVTNVANNPWFEFSQTLAFLPPANDDCAGAVSLTPGASCVNTAGTLQYATPNAATPLGCFAAGTYYDVWYSFVASTYTHTINLSSLGSKITNPRIQVYGGTCGALVSMGCASASTLTQANLIPGNTYYVRVANFSTDPTGAGTAADFNICITSQPPAANDLCTGSTLLTSGVTCTNTTGNLQYAASNGPAATCGGATATTTYDVWYRFVANSTTHAVTLSSLGSNLSAANTYIETFSGACGSLTSIDCQDAATPAVVNGLTVGATYYVRVYVTTAPNNATTANWNFNICVQQPPANDECVGAINLAPGAGCVNTAGTLNLASANGATPLGCFAAGTYYDVWYKFTATTTIENITLSSLGANFTASRIQLYSGTCGSLTSIACVTGTSLLQYGLTAGATYYVRVANYNVGLTSAATFNICVTYITPPVNDECTGATTLTSATACSNTSGTLLNSSPNSSGLPSCGNAGSAEVWYKFIANSNRPVITLSGLGSNLSAASPYIQLFSGFCGSLTPLACAVSPLNTAVTPGGVGLTINSTYYIRVTTNTATGVPTSGNWGFSICITDPTSAAVDFAKTYVNITDGTAGGTIDPGDVLEIRSILVVQRPSGSSANVAIDSVAFYDTLTANKGFALLKDSMALKTNEGKLFRPSNSTYFTDLSTDADAGWITTAGAGTDTALQMNMGAGATRFVRGKLTHTSRPSNFGATCIIMATYRVRVNAVYGTKIEYGGGAFRYRDSTSGIFYTINFPTDSLIVYASPGACPDAASATNVVGDEFGGTFGAPTGAPVYLQNRAASANTNYAYATFAAGNGPGDYYYGVANNTSGNGTVVQTVPKPSGGTTRVFGMWDITGDHTGAANTGTTSKGNLPCNLNLPISATNPCGYMLVVNSAYRADKAFEYNFSGACTETYYEISAWVKNICSKCGCDSLGTGSSNAGYKPTGPGDSSGVRPNLAFQINDIDYYTTGDIVHQGVVGTQTGSDTLNRWVRRSFVYKTQPNETNFTMTFRNNAPGGGGNDWAIDDISIRTCYPNMTYSPSITPSACANSSITLTDTVRSYYNTYTQYKWQRSTDGGFTWTDIAGTTASATPVNVSGMYQFVTAYTIPAANTTPANAGDKYRVVVATNAANLASSSCNFTDAIGITLAITQSSTSPSSVTGADICKGSSTTLTAVGGALGAGANYQWGTGSVIGTNPIAGATSSTLTVSPTTTTTYWVRTENNAAPCPATTSGLIKIITVTDPSIAPTSITGADVCAPGSTTLTAVGGTLGTGANYQWGTGSVVGTNPIAGATGVTLTVSPTSTTTYWVRIENNAAPCPATTGGVTKVVTVTQGSTAPTSITGLDICNPGSTTLTAVGGALGTGANYQWGTGSVVGTNPIAGATSATLTVSPTTTTTYWVQIQNNAAPCPATTTGVTKVVTVSQPSVAPTSITGADFCNPGSTTLTAIGGTLGTGANYQWGTGSVVGTNPIAGATSSTLAVSPTTTTTYWVQIQNNAAPCPATTGGVTKVITVTQPSVAPTSISTTAATICNPGSVTLTAVGGTLGTGANYQWGTGSVVGTNPIAGATSSTLTVSPTSTTTYWVQIQNTASPCTATTGGVTTVITVNQPSVAPTSITGADFCNPGSTTLTAIGGTLGTGANYQWGTGSVVGTNPIAGATSSTLTVSPTTTTTYWVQIQNNAAPCTATTGGVTKVITVSQPSTAPTSITGADICNPGSTTLTAVGGVLGTGANYQWGTGSVVGTNPIAGATSSTLTVSPTTTTTYWVRIENNAAPCPATTAGVTKVITVSQPSTAPTSITGADICNPGSTTLTAVGGVLGTGANYQWGTGSVVGTNPIAGATSSTLTVSPTTTTTYWVRIENNAAPCPATTAGVTKVITVSQPSTAPTSITGADICNPGSTTLTAVGGVLGTGANYQWGTGSVVGTNPIAGATSSTLTVSPTTTTTYWVQIQNTTAPCTASTGGVTKVITVSQPSTAPTSITGADICNPGSTTLTAVGGVLGTGANYQWGTGSVVGTNPIAGATSSTLTVSPTTTTTYWVQIQNNAAPCPATTTGVTKVITVSQPSVAPTGITGANICNPGSTTLTAVGGTLGTGANYQWGTGSVVGTNPIAGATSSTLTVSPTTTTTYWVQIQNNAAPCPATTTGVTKVITVSQPSVAPTSITGADICNPGSTTLTAVGGTLGTGANYQWGTGSVVGTNPIAGATSSTLTVSPTTTTTYWVQIQNTTAPCTASTGGVTKVITVTQPSVAPTSISTTAATICNPGSATLTAVGGTLGTGANYQWGTGSVVGTNPIAGATSATLTVSPTSTTTYWVQIQNTTAPCTATTGGVTTVITVNQPSVAPTSITGADFCNPGSTTLTAVGGTLGTGANYQWGTGSVVGTNPIAGATSSTLTVSPTSTTTYWVQIQNSAAPCSATGGVTKVITVNQPSVAPTSITGADFCNPGSTTLTAIGGTLGTGANYQWGTGTVVGTNPIAGATSSTLTVSPTSTTTYWVQIQNTTAPCTATTGGVTKVITVTQPSVVPTSISTTAATICNPGSATLTAIGGTLGTGANYQWGTGSVVGTNPIAGATSSTLTVSPTSTTTYWVQIQNTASPCTATTGGVTTVITVSQPSVAPTSITGSDFCNPGSTTLTAIGGTLGTGANYQWGTGAVVGTNPIAGATSATLTVSPTGTTTYWVQIQNTTSPCTATTGGVTKVITVTQPSVAPSSISTTATTICNPGSVTLTAIGGTLGTGANYQWGTGSVVGTNPIAGATSSTLTVSPTTTTTYWVQIQNTTSPCTATTAGVTRVITVNQPSVAPTSITGADFCNPGSATLTAIGGTLGTGANYQWGTGSVIGTNPIAGATSATLTVSPTSTTTYWVQIQNTTTPCTATTGGVTKVITVTQPSTAPSSISTTATTLCNSGSVTLTAVGGTLGTGANYQWGTGAVIGTNPIAGATSSTLTVTVSATTTYWVQIQNTTSPCTATTAGVTRVITVNQSSIAPTSITGADFCNPGSTTLTAIGGTLGTGANYQWGTGAVVGTNPIAGATSVTLTVSPTSTTTYWVQIQNTTAPCTATTAGVTKVITVTQPSVAPSSVSASAASICTGGSTTLTAVGGTLGTGANYQWGTGSVVGTNPIAGATSATLTVSPTTTTTYWVQIQNTTSPCTATTAGVTRVITVNQPSVAPTSITGTDYCNPGSTTLTAIGGTLGTGANYQWGTGSVIGTNPIAGATSATLSVSPASTTTYWVRIENGTAPCTVTTAGITKLITVGQPSVAATGATKNKNNICPGISVTLSVVGGTLGSGASWKWYTGSPGGTLVGTGSSINVTPMVTTTYYVRAEGGCNTTTDQSVTVFISCDIDKDKDGIPDFVESTMSAAFADANSNGVINAYDVTYAGFVDNNNDFINDNFQADGDSDNDGIPNYLDTTFPGRVDSNGDGVDDRFDADKDGIINMLDLDSDNDGIPDTVEAYGVDTNGDGKIDNFTDTDGDGLSQNVDINNTGAYNTGVGLGNIDLDGDGVPNFIDLDSDNDGIPDVVESGGVDTNNDGVLDGFTDANGDGLHDLYTGAAGLLKTGADANNDGKADSYPNKNLDQDFRPNAYDIDSDGDGIVDVIEAGLPDVNMDGKIDGIIGTNGWSGTVSAMTALNLRNTDGRGNPDYLDIDADDDGIPDNIEGQPTATYKLPVVTDTDGDGLIGTYDNVVGFGGSGIFVYDHDGDGIPDYRDLDTDGDGQPDIVEGNDFNLNTWADDNVTLTGLDTDGDGLDNRFDSLNSTTNLKGTSYRMGNNGSLVGDPTPGSRTTVQKATPTQSDRDWRYVGIALPIEFVNFSGTLQNVQEFLKWTIITTKDIDHFEIERSLDNTTYTKVGTVNDPVKINEQQTFNAIDDITGINNEIIYYRLKVVGKAGEIKYSNVLVVRRSQTKTPVTVMPNPANDYVAVRFFVEKESEVTLRMVDNVGKTVLLQKQKVLKGNNVIQLSGLGKYSAGVYMLQVVVNDEIVTKKIILER